MTDIFCTIAFVKYAFCIMHNINNSNNYIQQARAFDTFETQLAVIDVKLVSISE